MVHLNLDLDLGCLSHIGMVRPPLAVILLQILMVSPWTHLVKNRGSLSITSEFQFKKSRSPKLKILGPLQCM